MSTVRQIGIRMTVDAQSVTTELPKAGREFVQMASQAEQSGARTTRSLAQVRMAVRDVVAGAGALHLVGAGLNAITQAITALPRNAFDYSKQLEVSQVGMAGILGSMTAINGQQTTYNQGLRLSSEYIRKLNDDALRTAATSQELTTVFQALLAPGLGAKMTLEEIRQLTVVGTNAVKSMGLESTQVVQELRDLVQGGITPASSTLASALGLKDSDIAKAKASSEGLFAFLMSRLQGFQASSEAFSETLTGKLDQVKEGATRVAAEGMEPLTQASKKALDEVSKLFVTFDQAGNATLNQGLVDGIREFSDGVVAATTAGRELVGVVWENREAVKGLAVVYGALKLGGIANDARLAVANFGVLAQAKRAAAAQTAANAAAEVKASADIAQATAQREAALTLASQQRAVAVQGELRAKVASAQAEVALQAAQIATARTTVGAIELSRSEVTAKMQAARATMAQAEAQIAAARSAGAQSFALATLKQGTEQLAIAQAAHAALVNELAVLGRQQTSVNASLTASTTAHAAATQAVKVASVELAATTAAGTTATVAATAATDKLTASKAKLSAAGSLAAGAASGLSAVVGALGGPFGIGIAAVGALAFKYWELQNAAKAAEQAQYGVMRLQGSLASGKPIEDRDLAKARSELERWKDIRDEMQRTGKTELTETAWTGLFPSKVQLATMDEATARIAFHQGQIRLASARMAADSNAGGTSVTLTAQSALQAFEKTVDGAKTASAAQLEYTNNVNAARQALENLKKTGASPEVVDGAEKKFAESEKAWATERDKKIKEMGASGVTAQGQAIDAQVATIKAGFKLQAEVTANGLADLAALREQDLVGEYDAIERRAALQMQELASKEAATRAELDAIRGKKDSAKEQATLLGELQEIAQKRASLEASTAREVLAADAQVLANLEKRASAERTAATQSQDKLRTAKLDQAEIGKTGAALGVLRAARMEDAARELERQAIVQDGIDLSGRASAALRDQAEAMRENFKVSGYNESARSVAEYARSIDDANQAVQFEQGLALLSQRDRDIALEQYRIAIGLKQQLAQIEANNPNDAEGAAKLKADARAAAMRATAAAATKVTVAETRRTVQQMDDIFRTGFANMANEGEDAFKAMGKSVVTTFKTDVADQIYRMFAQPIVLRMAASVTGGLEAIFGGSKAGGNDLASLISNGTSLYSAATGNGFLGSAVNTVGGWLGFGSAAATTGLGLSAATGAGVIGSGLGASLGLGSAAAGAGTGLGLSLGGTGLGLSAGSAGAGAIGAGLGTSAAAAGGAGAAATTGLAGSISSAIAAVPVWGWIAAAVMAVGAALSKKPTPHSGGAVYSDPGLTTAINPNDKDPIGFSSYVDKETLAKVTSVASNAQAGLNAVLSTGTSKSPLSVLTGFADDKSKDGAWGQLIIKKLDATVEDALVNWENTRTEKWAPKVFADGEEGFKQYQNAVAADSIAALKSVSSELPAWTNRMVAAANTSGENTAEVFAKLVTDISEYPAQILTRLGTSGEALTQQFVEGLRSGDPLAAGANFAQGIVGGIENALVSNLGNQVQSLVTSGMVTPFVDSLLSGATASEALAAMSTEATLARVKAQATAFKEIWGNADFQAALEELRTTISSTTSAAVTAADYTPRFTAAIVANTAATQAGTDAQREAEEAAKRIAEERKNLQDQIDQLTMTRAELLMKERNAIDASNRDLFDRLTLLQRQQAVQEGIAAVAERYMSERETEAARYAQMAQVLQGAGVQAGTTEIEAALRAGTKEQFRALAEQIIASGDSTLDLQEALVQIAGTYADIKDAAQAAAQASRETAMSAAQRLLDTSLAGVQRAAEAQKKSLAEQLSADKEALQEQADAQRDSIAGIKSIFDAIQSAIKTTVVESQELDLARRNASMGLLQNALEQVRAGTSVADIGGLEDALGVLSKPSEQLFGRFDDYARSQDAAADAMRQLGNATDGQLTEAEKSLKAQQDAVKALDRQYELDVQAVDMQLDMARETVDVLRGIDTSVLTMGEAMSELAAAIRVVKSASGATGISPTTGYTGQTQAMEGFTNTQVVAAVDYIRNAGSRGDIMAVYQGAKTASLSVQETASLIAMAGYQATAEDVRSWVAAQGLEALPESRKFATGAAFGGGIVRRPTYFDMGQMGEAGEEGILPLANVNGKLGVHVSGARDTESIVSAIAALQVQMELLVAAAEATATHAHDGKKATLELVDRGITVRNSASEPLVVTP